MKGKTLHISEEGLSLIKKYEGLRLQAYYCPAGVLTIGYGHTGKLYGSPIGPLDAITQEQADDLLESDILPREVYVRERIDRKLTQGQFDAMVSFVYNIGYISKRLKRFIEAKDDEAATELMLQYNKATVNGVKKVLPGLEKRRKEEVMLYRKDI